MDINKIIEIDLAEFGVKDGSKIVLSAPTFRRMNTMKNAIRRCMSDLKLDRNNPPKMGDIMVGDMEIIVNMVYVKEAPFLPDIDGWLTYADMLDNIQIGTAEAVFERIKTEAKKIDEGEVSPLPNSPKAVTENSV